MEELKLKFETLSAEQSRRQARNPFSCSFDLEAFGEQKRGLVTEKESGNREYGRPERGSLTEKRGKQAHAHISNEILKLCQVIRLIGDRYTSTDDNDDTNIRVTFGDLFRSYENKSNKVVGILLRARRLGLVDFDGEMLWHPQDEHVLVVLLDASGPS